MTADSPNAMRAYPHALDTPAGAVTIGLMQPAHAAEVQAFARTLPEHDLLFLRRDISQPRVIDAWMAEIATGSVHSLVALHQGRVVGCTALLRDELSWSPHVGELRVLVGPAMRGFGLGRTLVQESFAMALGLGLEKLVAHMTVDQRGAIAVFEELGFRAEALLKNHVKDRAGQTHDIALLSHDVAGAQSQIQALGLA
ncbi:GNAT family N-acetyltransferase [soil metagenome]